MANSNTTELFEALTLLAKEKGIDPAVLIEKIQTALVLSLIHISEPTRPY